MCLSVCEAACAYYVCVFFTAQTDELIWMKPSKNEMTYTCPCLFRRFWNFDFDDVMAAILHFCFAALSRSQFDPIFFKFKPKRLWCKAVSAIENK